jgi:hypothetical protein
MPIPARTFGTAVSFRFGPSAASASMAVIGQKRSYASRRRTE